LPKEDELRHFLRQVYVEVYDFECGQRFERQAENDIRGHIVTDSMQACHVWKKLEHFFADANQRGIRITPASLRKTLSAEGLILKSPPEYVQEISRLRELTTVNLSRLEEHTTLRFGSTPNDTTHIPRTEEISALLTAAKSGHFLITGEPGCGKSGLIHQLVVEFQKNSLPVVLLLAEEIFGRDWKASANLPGFAHALDEVLVNWPNGAHGFLVTDALDAVRDIETQKMLRRLLRDVQKGQSGWTVIASVREYDLQYGQELREAFPGVGIAGHASNSFSGVAHFHLSRLSESQLDDLAKERTEIRPFIESARKSAKSEGIHRSPFYLRLAAELLRDGEKPLRLADWNSPAVLLRKFWDARIKGNPGSNEREIALQAICRQIVKSRNMTISLKELSLGASERTAVDELRGRGILQSPALLHGTHVGNDEIRFTHHLLHDYAIARSLIPETPVPFCDFITHDPLLPIFYRQSVLFALEELWDAPDGRKGFWEAALKLEGVPNLRGITRILAPILAARRVDTLSDLQPLLVAVGSTNDVNAPAQKAVQHVAAGLQDASEDTIRVGSDGWCAFAEQLARLLSVNTSIEMPLVHILARLNAINVASDATQRHALNAAGRGLLTSYVAKEVSKSWPYMGLVAMETVCRTFNAAPTESEHTLLALLTPERLAQFPHNDLHYLANNLKYLSAEGDTVVLRLFSAAFNTPGPEPGQYEDTGSAIMSLRFQKSDQWDSVQYALSEYYQTRNGENAALMTEAVCIAWNSVVGLSRERHVLATIQFRGITCELIEDYSHISGRSYEYNGNRILTHFEKLLREWAAANDSAKLDLSLNRFAACNHTSMMWTVFMEAGAEYPSTFGVLLECVLDEPTFLTALDYSYGGTALFGALHKIGDAARRERLEKLILDLPNKFQSREGENHNPTPSRIEYAQNRLLGALEESNIVLEKVRELWRARKDANALETNRKHQGAQVISHTYTNEEMAEQRGIDLKKPENEEMFHLREALKPFLDLRNKKELGVKEAERNWPIIQQCERALKRYTTQHPAMANELWGHLVSACDNIAGDVTSWPRTDKRWKTIRRILLKASTDPLPAGDNSEDTKDDGWPSWGWPAPRLDAARGLPFLAYRIGGADKEIAAALRKLCLDKSVPLRFNLAERLAVLAQYSPDLMWELIDTLVDNERKSSVLDMLLIALDRLWGIAPKEVKLRVRQIADHAMRNIPAKNHIHETLGHTYLFNYLRTGDSDCWTFIAGLISECDSERASQALGAQLHGCRAGGWLTAGDGVKPDTYTDEIRARTWNFLLRLLTEAQAKLQLHRDTWGQLHKDGKADSEAAKQIQEKIKNTIHLIDGIAMQLFFACGAFDEKNNKEKAALTQTQLLRFWHESFPLFTTLATEPHPHTAHQIVQTLQHLLQCAPRDVFLLAAKTICNSAKQARFQYESLAVGDVVKLIQRVLADHRDIFQNDVGQESECLVALLEVLDLFVEAGWLEARQLTHRLEEIYR
jgi:hypothetical protein